MKVEIEIILSSQRVSKKEEQMAVKIIAGEKYHIDVGYRRFFNKKVKVVKKLDNGAFKVKLLEEAGLAWPKFTKIVNVNSDELSLTKHEKMKRAFNEVAPASQQREKVRRGKGTSEDRQSAKKNKKKG